MEVIPKIIHYCWFGGNPKSKLIKKCIRSWQDYLPDYEIKCWDESNSELNIPFVKEAYQNKKWAFVSDYIRLKVLYQYGGIYMDTDMIVLRKFDDLLNNQCFFGVEESEFLETAIIGSKKKHPFIHECLNQYEKLVNFEKVNLTQITSPKIVSQVFQSYYENRIISQQILKFSDLTIYPKDYFYSLPVKSRYNSNYLSFSKDCSYAMHLWDASWAIIPAFKLFRQKYYYRGLKMMLKELIQGKGFSIKYYKKIGSSIKQSLKIRNI